MIRKIRYKAYIKVTNTIQEVESIYFPTEVIGNVLLEKDKHEELNIHSVIGGWSNESS